jgi:hypothetical protein
MSSNSTSMGFRSKRSFSVTSLNILTNYLSSIFLGNCNTIFSVIYNPLVNSSYRDGFILLRSYV